MDMLYELIAMHHSLIESMVIDYGNNLYQLKPTPGFLQIPKQPWEACPSLYTRTSRRLYNNGYSLFLFGFRVGYGSFVLEEPWPPKYPFVLTTYDLSAESLADMGIFSPIFIDNMIDDGWLNYRNFEESLFLGNPLNSSGYRSICLV